MTREQFDVLALLEEKRENVTPEELDARKEILAELTAEGLVENGMITLKGICALEPYRVKRAVIIAAGFGSRMVPITLNTPKPLVRVHGKRIIEGILDAIVHAGIEEIYIVRGYLGEQFDQLLYKYPMIKFVENPLYNEANNISSAMLTRHMLRNAYVFEADLLLHNESLIKKYHYCSNFLGIPVEESNDWCFVTENGIIKEQKTDGGTLKDINQETQKLYQEVGISYWSTEDGEKLETHIRQVYEMPGGKARYWDQVPLNFFIQEYDVEIRECQFEDIIEIDTYAELKVVDPVYV